MKRKNYLDIARTISIVAVVILHTVSGVLAVYEEEMTQLQIGVYGAIRILCAFAVPVFLMISGALFLPPEKEISLKDLFGKYIRRLLLALLLFGTVFCYMELFVNHKGFYGSDILQAVKSVLTGECWAHMWYLYMLIGIYLIMPVLKAFTAHASKKVYIYVLILLFLFQVLLPFIGTALKFSCGIQLPIASVYVFYFLFGYYCDRYVEKSAGLFLISVAGCALSITCIVLAYVRNPRAVFQYDSLYVAVFAMCLFVLFKRINAESRLCRTMNPYVFGIYLIHPFFLNLFYKGLHISPLAKGGFLLILLFAAVTFLLSFAAVWILRKLPFMRKWVL